MASIGIISVGSMGSTLIESLSSSDNKIFAVISERSEETIKNAERLKINIVNDYEELFKLSDFVFCILRTSAWRDFSEMAVALNFDGIYVDFNGLQKNDIDWIESNFKNSGVCYVDAALRAWPTSEHKEIPNADNPEFLNFEPRTMYLHGEKSEELISIFCDKFWKFVICEKSAKSKVLEIAGR